MSKDRRRIKGSAMARLLYDFVPNRVDATVYMNHKIDVTEFVKFMKKIKKDNPNVTMFHGLVTMLGKTIYSRPKMNYFVQNRKLYEHTDVSITFVAKEKFEDESIELQTTVKIKPEDTLYDISDYIYNRVKKIRASKASGIDNVVETLGNMPNPIRIPIMGLFKWLDKKNLLPNSLREGNLYYSSTIVSNLGTFKTGAIYHHLVNFGTCSSLITFGEIVEDNNKYYMEIGATIDERIADGFYFVKALKLMEYMFKHPEVMLEPASKKVSIPENER